MKKKKSQRKRRRRKINKTAKAIHPTLPIVRVTQKRIRMKKVWDQKEIKGTNRPPRSSSLT